MPPGPSLDPRLAALSYAVLAPNAHNTQPWLLDLRRPGEIDLYVDPTRLLPETDPPCRQIHISQGTFLEHLDIAAREQGYRAETSYFPAGEYGADTLVHAPVATVRLLPEPQAARDPLFACIAKRITNRHDYDRDRPLSAAQVATLQSAPVDLDGAFTVVAEPSLRDGLASILGDAMAVETSQAPRNVETARWFRFSEAEIVQRRDGFGLGQTGASGFDRWFAETFLLSRRSAGDPRGAFASGAVDRARAQARSAPAFGLLVTNANTRLAQVLAGRAYARIALTATALGLAIHPMTQITEEYRAMAALRGRFSEGCGVVDGRTAQMVVRLGTAVPHAHSPRRDVRDMQIA